MIGDLEWASTVLLKIALACTYTDAKTEGAMYMTSIFSSRCVFLVSLTLVAQLPPPAIANVLVRYPARKIQGDACLSSAEEIRSEIIAEVSALLRAEVVPALLSPCSTGGCRENPARSCLQIASDNSSALSGLYWVENSDGSAVRVFCDMNRHCCNSTGGWVRVANLNMTDPDQDCPEDFTLIQEPRSCGKNHSGCVSTTFETQGIQYSKVCGRILAYQEGEPDAFKPYVGARNRTLTLEDLYLDGVSITHGLNPRHHIWSFVAAHDEAQSTPSYRICPCTRANENYTSGVPPFIEEDYFCETGSREEVEDRFYVDDPLWDGQGCGENSTCCSWNNPPWFCKDLARATDDDIEVRLCSSSGRHDEHTPIALIEVYTQ